MSAPVPFAIRIARAIRLAAIPGSALLRGLLRRPLYSGLNIAGLAAGFFACILILLFVRDEMSFDYFFSDADDLYRIVVTYNVPGRDPIELASSPPPAGPGLSTSLREITHTARLIYQGETMTVGTRTFTDTVSYVDPTFFEIFDFDLLEGNRATALARPASIILTQSLADRYFPNGRALGRSIRVQDFNASGETILTVTGVMADLPPNTHLAFTALAPISAPSNGWPVEAYREWATANLLTYVRVARGTDGRAFQRRVRDWSLTAIPDIEMMGTTLKSGSFAVLTAQQVTSIHLTSARQGEVRTPGNLVTVTSLTGIAFLIMLIATVNFMNLTTAQTVQRAKELSMRKIAGAQWYHIAGQVFGEVFLLTLAAFILAIAGVELALPSYNTFLDKALLVPYAHPMMLAELMLLVLLTAGLGAVYPAWLATRIDPVRTLKGERVTGGMTPVQTSLVVLQFATAIALITATLIVYSQTRYAKTIDLGWDKADLVVVSGMGRDPVRSNMKDLEQGLLERKEIISITFSTAVPTEEWEGNVFVQRTRSARAESHLMRTLTVAPNFFETYGIETHAGGNTLLTLDPQPDRNRAASVVINETAARRLGYLQPRDALNADLLMGMRADDNQPYRIAAVVGDMHFHSAREAIVPTVYVLAQDGFWDMTVRLHPERRSAAVTALDSTWQAVMGDIPIQRRFLEDSFNRLYDDEDRQGLLLALFSMLSLFVACLGLFGLATLTAERRTKEIGIRKVLGASTIQILTLVIWQFTRPVVLANLIAWPVSFFVMNRWLDAFAYRIDLNPLFFLSASMLAFVIALGTVALHGIRIAMSEPARALRYE